MNIHQSVKDYYGSVLNSSSDLKTDACCTIEDTPQYLRTVIENVHPDVRARYYGCGLIAPLCLKGLNILDLGSGAGQDVFALAQLTGPAGSVTGVDMTREQLDVARAHEDWHADKFGFANTRFIEDNIEKLEDLPLEPASFNVVVSNCVINLAIDKLAIFSAVRRLLKPGGEFYFADVYADRRLPDELRSDPVAVGECLGGALYWNDFLSLAKRSGFIDPRLVSARPIAVNNPELSGRVGLARFFSATYRLFNISGLDDSCEDYGQAVRFAGGVDHNEMVFELDAHHHIEKGRIFPVCRNTFRMLSESRFAPYFEFIGDDARHMGLFPGCGEVSPFEAAPGGESGNSACC